MIPTEHTRRTYTAFGLSFHSEIELPELAACATDERPGFGSDVEITYGDLTEEWLQYGSPARYFIVHQEQVLFRVPNTATFSIREGRHIIVSPMAEADERLIRVYLLGSCIGALLFQRKVLPLHGSAVVIGGKAYAIVGDSGAGKSTLAAALVSHGFPLVSDDVIAVSLDGRGSPMVWPSYPQQKLWEESLNHLGLDSGRYEHLSRELTKFAVPVASRFAKEPAPLCGVFELVKGEQEKVLLEPLTKLERLPALLHHTYRNFLVPMLGLGQWHFASTAKLAAQVDMFRMSRPLDRFTAGQLVDTLLQTITKDEVNYNEPAI